MKKRNLKDLEAAIASAKGKDEKALAHYRCGLFHDNNGRESKAIPHYQKAISLGLEKPIRAQAFAWLASSFSKTDRPTEAVEALRSSMRIAEDPGLRKFLTGLEGRIQRRYGNA
jgi:tetratricopeptide (TPR) repeat protein